MAANRFDQLIEKWWPTLKDVFLGIVQAMRRRAQVRLIAEMLDRGDVEGAVRAVHLDEATFRDLERAIEQAYEEGGRYTAEKLPALQQPDGYRLDVVFDVRNPRAEAWLKDHSSTLVKEIVADQQQMIREALRAGMEAGQNPRTVALDLVGRIDPVTGNREGGKIGLTSSQEAWVRDYRAELETLDVNALERALRDKRFDRTVAKAIREGKPIPAATVKKMVTAYTNRALRYRAETIARTEALTSLHAAQIEATRQAIDAGQINEGAVTKKWRNSADNRVRDTHRALGGQTVAFEAKFVSPSGAQLLYPGDPSAPARERVACRCWMEVEVDFLAGIT